MKEYNFDRKYEYLSRTMSNPAVTHLKWCANIIFKMDIKNIRY